MNGERTLLFVSRVTSHDELLTAMVRHCMSSANATPPRCYQKRYVATIPTFGCFEYSQLPLREAE